jgi:hypothetical protein
VGDGIAQLLIRVRSSKVKRMLKVSFQGRRGRMVGGRSRMTVDKMSFEMSLAARCP